MVVPIVIKERNKYCRVYVKHDRQIIITVVITFTLHYITNYVNLVQNENTMSYRKQCGWVIDRGIWVYMLDDHTCAQVYSKDSSKNVEGVPDPYCSCIH